MANSNPDILKEYKTMRNKIKSKLKKEKKEYYQNKFKTKELSTKEVWKTATPSQIFDRGSTVSSPERLANIYLMIYS